MDNLETLTQQIHEATRALREAQDRADEQLKANQTVSEETRAQVDAANAAINELQKEQREILAKLNRPESRPNDEMTDEQQFRHFVYEKFLRFGAPGDRCNRVWTQQETKALNEIHTKRETPLNKEMRSLIGASDVTGQFLVPDDFENQIIMQAYQMAALRQYANVRPTSRDTVTMPAIKKPVFAWGHRGVDVTAQTMATGAEIMPINELTGLMLISNDTLEDADADIFGELSDAFAPGLAEMEDTAFAVGVGDDSPQGIVSSGSGVQTNYTATGVAAAIYDGTHNGVDALITAMGALKSTYRSSAVWGMNSATEAAYRKLKDGNGRYLWEPSVQADKPPTLLGRPVVSAEGMPDIAANAFPVFLGSLERGYRIRDRRGVTVQRLVERYAEKRQTGFLVTKRTGGQVVLAEAFRCIKVAAS